MVMSENEIWEKVNTHEVSIALLDQKLTGISADVNKINDNFRKAAWMLLSLAGIEVVGLAGSNIVVLFRSVFGV
jgi:hypothetical protein